MSEMDIRTARVVQGWLEADHPGTVWEVTLDGPEGRVTLDASTGLPIQTQDSQAT